MRVGVFSGRYVFTAEIAAGYAEENKNLEVAKAVAIQFLRAISVMLCVFNE